MKVRKKVRGMTLVAIAEGRDRAGLAASLREIADEIEACEDLSIPDNAIGPRGPDGCLADFQVNRGAILYPLMAGISTLYERLLNPA